MGQSYQRVDPISLQRLIEDSGVAHKKTTRSFVFHCPRCDKKDKLMMFRNDGRFICWVCAETSNFRGRPEYALEELTGLPLKEIKAKIYGDSSDEVSSLNFSIQLLDFYAEDEEVPEDLLALAKGITWPLDFHPVDHPHAKRGLEYLESRGINRELAMQYGLRYCPPQRRVIFPINVGTKLLGWQARATFQTEWEDEETGEARSAPKILTTGRRDVLMFSDRLIDSEHAVLCEGPVDALKAHLCGGNIATMGKATSASQIALLRRSGVKRIYLAMDPDANVETMRLAKEFGDLELYRLIPPKGFKDLGEMQPEQVLKAFEAAPRLVPGQLLLHFRTA